MNDFLDKIDKFKYGILAAVFTYFCIFMYVQWPSVEFEYQISPYLLEAEMEIPEDEIELLPENIKVDMSFNAKKDIKNTSRDENDTRERSDKNYSPNRSLQDVEQDVRDYEQKMFEEAGGKTERERIKQEMDKRKAEQNKKNTNKQPTNQNQPGGNNAPKGDVLVSWSLKGRSSQSVPAPGYMCDQGAVGKITIRIRVEQSGYVSDAKFDPSLSTSSNGCMVEYALEFARKSRFNYSSSAPGIQEGTITYTFVYQ